MGVVQSIAQGNMNRVAVRLSQVNIYDIPDIPGSGKAVGTIDATIGITTHDVTAADATVRSTLATLEMPPVDGIDGFGPFAHFVFPEIDIREGTKSHTFSSDFVITNQSLFSIWSDTVRSSPAGVPAVLRAMPEVQDLEFAPVSSVLNMDKEVQCISLSADVRTSDVALTVTCDYLGQAPAAVGFGADTITSTLDAGWVMDLENGNTKTGTRVTLFKRHSTDTDTSKVPLPDQYWLFDAVTGAIMYANDTSKCISIPSIAIDYDGSDNDDANRFMRIQPCDGSDQQHFRVNSTTDTIEPKINEPGVMCVDLKSAKLSKNQAIGLWPCSGAANQQWSITPFVDPYNSMASTILV